MNKLIIIITVLLFVILLSSCQQDTSSIDLFTDNQTDHFVQGMQEPTYTIGLVMKTLTNPFFVDMEKGARQAEEEMGIKMVVRTGAKETSTEQQIQIVEDLIANNVDAIVIAPGSSIEIIPVLKKAQDSGIIIVNIDNRLDEAESKKHGLDSITFISVDNEMGAYLSVKEITRGISDSTQALILEGITTAENSRSRVEGAKRAFGESPHVKLVSIQSANWKIDEAYEHAKNLFELYPDIRLVFCANDMMALGVIQYLKDESIKDVRVAGFDNLDYAREAIAEGWMNVTIDQQAAKQGYLGIKAAYDLLSGFAVDNEILIPVKVITK